jgi:hypothetical protein
MTGAQYSFKQANSDTFFGVLYYSQERNIRSITGSKLSPTCALLSKKRSGIQRNLFTELKIFGSSSQAMRTTPKCSSTSLTSA